jgi:Flp pilus assembly protein TadG
MKASPRTNVRSAAAVVETGIVLSSFLLLFLGIFEYGRFVMTLQIMQNAAREGARVAVATTNTSTTGSIQAVVTQEMCGIDSQLVSGVTVTVTATVLKADPNNPSKVVGSTLSDWTTAAPTDGITVTVTGTYATMLPKLLSMSSTIPITTSATMYSEGN